MVPWMEDTATAIVSDFQSIGNRSMIWSDSAFEQPKAVLGTVNPDILNVPVADAYDRSVYQKLIDNGFYAALGIDVPSMG